MATDAQARDRVIDDVARLARSGAGAEQLFAGMLGALDRVIDVHAACWHLTDPVSGLPVSGDATRDAPGTLSISLHYEFEREDYSRMADLAGRRVPVAVLSTETDGRLSSSARYREMLEPGGAADELRVSFVDPFGPWGSLVLFSATRRYTDADADLLARMVPSVAQGLRIGLLDLADLPDADDAPAVVVLDGDDRVELADARAAQRLELLGTTIYEPLPAALSVVSALARLRDPLRPARARARYPNGRWIAVDGTPLDEEPRGRIAIVIQPASAPDVLDAALRSLGLTAREREIASRLVAGRMNKEIAFELGISAHTVGDHVKAVFEKTGARSRGELQHRVFTAPSAA